MKMLLKIKSIGKYILKLYVQYYLLWKFRELQIPTLINCYLGIKLLSILKALCIKNDELQLQIFLKLQDTMTCILNKKVFLFLEIKLVTPIF